MTRRKAKRITGTDPVMAVEKILLPNLPVPAPALEVGPDHQPAAAAEACALDLQVLHDACDVVARLGDRDPLDPVHRVDIRIARIAVGRDPLLHAAAAGVVTG